MNKTTLALAIAAIASQLAFALDLATTAGFTRTCASSSASST